MNGYGFLNAFQIINLNKDITAMTISQATFACHVISVEANAKILISTHCDATP